MKNLKFPLSMHALRHNQAVSREIMWKWRPHVEADDHKVGDLHAALILLTVVVQAWFFIKVIVYFWLTLSWPISLHSHKPPGTALFWAIHMYCVSVFFNPTICTCASNFWGRFPQLKCSLRIKLTFGSYDFSFKMKMNSKSKRFSYLGKLNTRERL